jgi:hypothetical protein
MVMRFGTMVARYTNCRRRHAEYQWSMDTKLAEYIKQMDPLLKTLPEYVKRHMKMTLFMKFQPCHHSAGNAKKYPEGYLFNKKADDRSCTDLVINFFNTVLKPRGLQLEIVLAGLYKVNWQRSRQEDDLTTVKNARQGFRNLLLTKGITLRASTTKDWIYLATFASDVHEQWLKWPSRVLTNEKIQEFIDDFPLDEEEDEELLKDYYHKTMTYVQYLKERKDEGTKRRQPISADTRIAKHSKTDFKESDEDKESRKATCKDNRKDGSKESSKESSKNSSKDGSKESSKQSSKESNKENDKESDKESDEESGKDDDNEKQSETDEEENKGEEMDTRKVVSSSSDLWTDALCEHLKQQITKKKFHHRKKFIKE